MAALMSSFNFGVFKAENVAEEDVVESDVLYRSSSPDGTTCKLLTVNAVKRCCHDVSWKFLLKDFEQSDISE